MVETVRVPEALRALFERAEELVGAYFAQKTEDPSRGKIEIEGERYLLIRAASLSVEFYGMMRDLYGGRQDEADGIARNLLFHTAHSIGRSDARAFHRRLGLTDPSAKLSAGPVHFSHAGWAFVDILPESEPVASDDYFLVYDHPYSFESASWQAAKKVSPFPICQMNTGYSSGWCEESFGIPLVATEILCTAKGDPCCRFIMAHPTRIEQRVQAYLASHPELAALVTGYEVPGEPEHKQLWDRLRFTEQKYRLLFENAPSAVFSIEDAKIDQMNRATTELLGLDRSEIRGRSFTEFSPPEQPGGGASDPLFRAHVARALAGQSQAFRWTCLCAPSRTVETEILLNRIEGSSGAVLAVVRDITERVRAEAESRRLEGELRQLQKMDAVGTLAGGIAHDFNNLLTGIMCNLDLIRRDLPEGSATLQRLDDARTGADRASALVRQLLTFARASQNLTEIVDVNAVATDTERLVREMVDRRIQLRVDTTDEPQRVLGDPNQLAQVLMNLVLNARDALLSGLAEPAHVRGPLQPEIRIQVSRVVVADPSARRTHADRAREAVCVAVTDNGPGMSESTLSRAFDPFFTTKPVGSGTGLGLTVAYGIVKRHSGRIELRSAPAQGTCATVFLALYDPRSRAIQQRSPVRTRIAGSETILFVDDEALFRDVMAGELRTLGYDVIVAVDGAEAVELFEARSAEIDAVVLDLQMPRVSGRTALPRILSCRPDARVIISSGNLDPATISELRDLGACSFVAKPYEPAALAGLIREVIDDAG